LIYRLLMGVGLAKVASVERRFIVMSVECKEHTSDLTTCTRFRSSREYRSYDANSVNSWRGNNFIVVSCLIDPDQPVITDVSAVTTTAVTLSWSTGNTSVISGTDVCYKDLTNGLSSLANCSYNASVSNVPSGMSYTISNLSPGRTYQFYVTVNSFTRSSTSAVVQQTTGKPTTYIQQQQHKTTNKLCTAWSIYFHSPA